MAIDDNIKIMAGSDPRSFNPKSSSKTTSSDKRKRNILGQPLRKPSAANPSIASKTSLVNNVSANDFQGNQQRNMELRGATLFLYPMGEGSPVDPGTIKTRSGGNIFMVNLRGDWVIDFDWSEYDNLQGSNRGNLRVDRVLFATLRIKHNGFSVSFSNNSNINWDEGEAPDLSPDSNGDGIHIINILAFKTGVDSSSSVEVHGSVWSLNSRASQ